MTFSRGEASHCQDQRGSLWRAGGAWLTGSGFCDEQLIGRHAVFLAHQRGCLWAGHNHAIGISQVVSFSPKKVVSCCLVVRALVGKGVVDKRHQGSRNPGDFCRLQSTESEAVNQHWGVGSNRLQCADCVRGILWGRCRKRISECQVGHAPPAAR